MTQELVCESVYESVLDSVRNCVVESVVHSASPALSPAPSLAPNEIVPLLVGSTVEAVERELVLHTLAHCDGNRTRAARVLGVSVRTLRNKIHLYAAEGISVPLRAE